MKIYLDCLPCFLNQVLTAARMVTDDEKIQKKILDAALDTVKDYNHCRYAPEIGRSIHFLVKQYTGVQDPYQKIKEKHLALALSYYSDLKHFLFKKSDRLYWALKIAAVGNVFDAAINSEIKDNHYLKEELSKEFKICDIQQFRDRLKSAGTILIIGDNAGETVFDKVLTEELLNLEIVYAVRSSPIINDATVEDVKHVGLNRQVRVISSGCDAPGVIRSECSPEFQKIFDAADIIISKGQGNYETLSEEQRELFFLLKAKCPVIADELEVNVGDYVFYNKL